MKAWPGVIVFSTLYKLFPRLKVRHNRNHDLMEQYGQITMGAELVDQIIAETSQSHNRTGMALSFKLPPEAAKITHSLWFDPYMLDLTREQLMHWVESHVWFAEDGRVVALHDYGMVLWREEGYVLHSPVNIRWNEEHGKHPCIVEGD